MANIKSAAKRARQTPKKYERNRMLRGSARTAVKQVREAIDNGDLDASKQGLHKATVALDKAASKGAIHKNNASRRKSRLAQAVNKLEKGEE